MKNKDKSSVVNELLELAKKSKLNSEQKKRIVKIVENLEDATETQKERFIIYYGFNDNGVNLRNLTKIAKSYGCTPSAVRLSVVTLKNKLSRLNEEFEIIEQVVTECDKNNKE